MKLAIRPATQSDADKVSALAVALAPYFLSNPPSSGAEGFLATLSPEAMAKRISAPTYRYFLAESGAGLSGFIALRDESHVYHLFVKPDAQRQGTARSLWEHARDSSGHCRFTVNSSLAAVAVYERFGFVATDGPQTKNGLAFVPMVYEHAS
jgi:ribosomal protein S18 acetylase RimI-like enzyme